MFVWTAANILPSARPAARSIPHLTQASRRHTSRGDRMDITTTLDAQEVFVKMYGDVRLVAQRPELPALNRGVAGSNPAGPMSCTISRSTARR